ncbi:MAG: YicC family protein [Candidatus Syntrophonatronum acetioxidans]|uniref:YicC family protein n=1 Tax=Candidatus Syntrophonatronum acetioxidans TaxID=1795816 RepID=A0A424YHR6_9FIRM|nr:MAG: YicC family protein [Candidatus Syntrophonatronum acetioxidans]
MISSMTGYGRGEAYYEGIGFVVEIRSVNHRYRDIFFRMPRELVALEEKMKQLIGEKVTRGRLEVIVTMKEAGERKRHVEVDLELARGYYQALNKLQEKFNLKDDVKLEQLAGYPDVLNVEGEELLNFWPGLEKALEESLEKMAGMRLSEGKNLAADIEGRLKDTEELLKGIEGRAPQVVEYYRQRLLDRLEDLLPRDHEVDQNRILTECTLFADRSDINEEITRLYSHLKAFKEIIQAGGTVGRKMDFLVQELYREINTIGSKANDYEIARLVVDIKSELEKIREQVQNIE